MPSGTPANICMLYAVMSVPGDEALIDLERNTFASAANFIRDTMKKNSERVQL